MQKSITISQMTIRSAGVLQIALGLLFWADIATLLVPVHMLIGLVFVLSLWALAVLATRRGAGAALPGLAGVWGVVIVALGVTQTEILRGDLHWIVEVTHLVVGLAGIAIAELLVRRVRSATVAGDASMERTQP